MQRDDRQCGLGIQRGSEQLQRCGLSRHIAERQPEPEERARLSKIFEQKLGAAVGYVLPLRRDYSNTEPRWESGRWHLRREHLYLLPGDSAMGFRLPLDSLPWEAPENRQSLEPLDPFAPRKPFSTLTRSQVRDSRALTSLNGTANSKPASVVRTALCVEPREGRLHVFMPPVRFIDDYLDLVATIEETAAATGLPVQIEGYTPPSDSRINHFNITPDPGVIEVNIHPAHTWPELVHRTETVYDEARKSRLAAEKFMVDGRHVGTGGGNHIVLGGSTPASSPILRRPDLLRSLVSFWNNHPSLS